MTYRDLAITLIATLFAGRCASYVKIPVVTQMPEIYAKRMADVKIIALAPPVAAMQPDTGEEEWSVVAFKSLQTSLGEQRFFVIVDSSAAAEALAGFATAEIPRPPEEKNLAKKIGVDGFLYMQLTGAAESNCSVRSYQVRKEQCSGTGKDRKCVTYYETHYESTRYTAVPVRGKLVSAKTQNTIVFADRAVHSATVSGSSCPSQSWSTLVAIANGAQMIAQAMSPTVTDMEIPLDADIEGTPAEKEAEVKALLKEGIALADKQDFRNARNKWMQALDLSSAKSAAAHWNIAVTFWMAGDYESATQHFNSSREITGIHFTNDREKSQTLAKFLEEKARFDAAKPAAKPTKGRAKK
ncbi:MAG: hypothetical protein JNJ69_06710 [Leptospiraceae bacterium]|nr:hypothetical protein [Leptospiraceae bacterium]